MQAQVLLALVALLIVNTKQKYLDAVTNMYIEEATLSFTIDAPSITSHEGKVVALTSHYKKILGEPGVSSFSFALNDLYVGRSNASARLIEEFTVSEALHAVRSMNRCSAPARMVLGRASTLPHGMPSRTM